MNDSTFVVYALYSERFNKIYIGYTSNLVARLRSHNELGTRSYTVKYRPWKVIHTELFNSKSEALKREKKLKTAAGRQFIWSLVK